MNLEEKNEKISQIFILRFFVTIVIYLANINPWLKILIILSLDFIKGLCYIGKFERNELVKNQFYQYYDKIQDLFGYYLSYFIITNNKLLPPRETKILLYTLLYRTIGDFIYLLTGNRKMLFYFFDVFKEFLLVFYLFKPDTLGFYAGIIISVVVKLWMEYRIHYVQKSVFLK